jgi:DNA replication protein DnaC
VASPASTCPICSGTGYRIFFRDGTRFAEDCECRRELRDRRRLKEARIPQRYEHCSFDSFEFGLRAGGEDEVLLKAQYMAVKFVENYPVTTGGRGLILTGDIGVGKTHLAISTLRSLILDRGVRGLFYDYRDLLKQIQNSYNPQVATTEMELLRPVFNAEVLVLDELGASKPSEWVSDMVAHILNTRYLDRRTTIITTNFANRPPGGAAKPGDDTLADRIGERMRSRLDEMCQTIEINGVGDFRKTAGRMQFAPWEGEFTREPQR